MTHIHKLAKCEGCGKKCQKRKLIWFCGHDLCGHCKSRKTMPLVGYKSKVVWDFEKKLLRKKRKERGFSKEEYIFLCGKYGKLGLEGQQVKDKMNELRKRIQVKTP